MKNKIILISYFVIICFGFIGTTVEADKLMLNRFNNKTNHPVTINIANQDFKYNKTIPAKTNQTFAWASIVLANHGSSAPYDGGNGVITIDGVRHDYSWLQHGHFFDIVINGVGTLRHIGIYPIQGRAWMAIETHCQKSNFII